MNDVGASFLQALGWATLNSFWQMALLWCVFQLVCHYGNASSNRRYLMATLALFAGAAWFLTTFFEYYLSGYQAPAALRVAGIATPGWFPAVLTSASLTYLILLVVPMYKVVRNWRFLQTIRKNGLEKAPIRHRLFVQKIAAHIGIKRTVMVHLSSLVTSPVTIGYLKPLILLPVAAISQLTPAQLEAVLLHELSHIRRHDYLLNLLLTIIHVAMYFNPFVKLFIRAVEAERENCCDELVLQFEYDKVSYASALLHLEKSNHVQNEFAMAATNKQNLLQRIERIVGVKRKARLNANHFLGAFAALLLLLTINSLVIASRKTPVALYNAPGEPVSYFTNGFREAQQEVLPVLVKEKIAAHATAGMHQGPSVTVSFYNELPSLSEPAPEVPVNEFINVAFDETTAAIPDEQKARVKEAVVQSRKALRSQWHSVEQSVPDGLLPSEKDLARLEYLRRVENIDWKKLEQNLNAGYDQIDWNRIDAQLSEQIALAHRDSIQSCYQQALQQLQSLQQQTGKVSTLAMPDASVAELKKIREELRLQILEMKRQKERKTLRL